MNRAHPDDIVRAALKNGEIEDLLLGAPEYQFRSKYSPAPGNTDLTELLDAIYRLDPQSRELAKAALVKALFSLSGRYEGIDAIASCILFEAGCRSTRSSPLGLPIEELAVKLRATIQSFAQRLRVDKTGGGDAWPDGRLGDLRRRSRNTEDDGGPPFWK